MTFINYVASFTTMCAFLTIIMLDILCPSFDLRILIISVEWTLMAMWATTWGGKGTMSNYNHFVVSPFSLKNCLSCCIIKEYTLFMLGRGSIMRIWYLCYGELIIETFQEPHCAILISINSASTRATASTHENWTKIF